MTDRRQKQYQVTVGGVSAPVAGLDGLCAILPPDAAQELRDRASSFYAALSAGAGRTTLRLATLPDIPLDVERLAPVARYSVTCWRGRILNSRTLDPEGATEAWHAATVSEAVRPLLSADNPDLAAVVQKRLPGLRSRLSNAGTAYIQIPTGDGRGVGLRITVAED